MAKTPTDILNDLRTDLKNFNATPDALAMELRLDLAGIIVARLKTLGWTQRDLAQATGLKESFISRIIHSNANCTLSTVATILAALDVRATLSQAASEPGAAKKSLRKAQQRRPGAGTNRSKRSGPLGGEAA